MAQVLYDMSMSYTLDASHGVGGRVLSQMDLISKLHRKQVEQAAFAILKSPDIPSLLVETGFISNPEEARLLKTRDYQRRMARAVYAGVKSWFVEHPPADTLLAWQKLGQPASTTSCMLAVKALCTRNHAPSSR